MQGILKSERRNMDYSNYIELDNITIQDCIDLLKYKNTRVTINDGHIVNLKEDFSPRKNQTRNIKNKKGR